MMRSTILALGLVSAPAAAGTAFDKWGGSIGAVTLEGAVEVPMYGTVRGEPRPSVRVWIGENAYLLELVPGANGVYVSEHVAEKEELKVRHSNRVPINVHGENGKWAVGGEFTWARVDEMRIGKAGEDGETGELVLTDVVVLTKDPDEDDYAAPFFENREYGDVRQGFIGLGALPPNVAWALQPSRGTVSFARGEAAAALVGRTDGVSLPFRRVPSSRAKYGKTRSITPSLDLVVEATIGGETMDVGLGLGANLIDQATKLPNALAFKRGDVTWRYLTTQLGGVKLAPSWYHSTTAFEYVPQLDVDGYISVESLYSVDMFVDPTAQTVRLVPTKGQTWNDPLPFLIAEAEKAVQPEPEEDETAEGSEAAEAETETAVADESAETEEGAEGDDEDVEEEKPPGKWSDWMRLADLYRRAGDTDAALAARETETQIDGRTCPTWLRLGKAQLRAGKIGDAIVSLETAADHYHSWYDLPLEERKKLEKKLKRLKDDDKPSMVAPASCHTADGWLAAALLSAGDFDTIESVYAERLDLDANLALATANARMAQGKFQSAQEPLRQAVKLNRAPSRSVRLGLAMVYEKAGDWGTAEGHFRRALNDGHRDTRLVEMWLDGLRKAKGADAALAAAKEFSTHNPESRAAMYGLVREAKSTGNADALEAAAGMADEYFADELDRYSKSAHLWGVYARYLLLVDRADEAKQAAELSVKLNPGEEEGWLALSDLNAAAGNTDDAKKFRLRAAQAAPFHPGYATMLGEF
jgi:tetratricopeptide (TPR) repeat protein